MYRLSTFSASKLTLSPTLTWGILVTSTDRVTPCPVGSMTSIAVEVDPDHQCLLDANPLNNGRLTGEAPAASRRWAARLRFWAQNAFEFFALLGVAGLS